MTAYELFEREGFLDDYRVLSHKVLLHAEEFLKLSRDAEVGQNTVIFGTVNRLNLIKNKMKNNESFHANAECVDTKHLLEWIDKERHSDAPRDEDVDVVENVLGADANADIFIEEASEENHIPKADESTEEDNAELPAISSEASVVPADTSQQVPKSSEPETIENFTVSTDEPLSSPQPSASFVYEYLVERTPVSSISSGFSVHDYQPKELADAFIKKLLAG
jgi:hypothetical protein